MGPSRPTPPPPPRCRCPPDRPRRPDRRRDRCRECSSAGRAGRTGLTPIRRDPGMSDSFTKDRAGPRKAGPMNVDVDAASVFLAGHGRMVGRHRLALVLGDGDPAAALSAVNAYRNPRRWLRMGPRTRPPLDQQPARQRAARLRGVRRPRPDHRTRGGDAVRLAGHRHPLRRRPALRAAHDRSRRLRAVVDRRPLERVVAADHHRRGRGSAPGGPTRERARPSVRSTTPQTQPVGPVGFSLRR